MKQKIQTLLADMNTGLIDREHAIKAALLSLFAAENLVLIGPPGTAKSMVARRVAQHIQTGDHAVALQDNSHPSPGNHHQTDTDPHDASRYFEYLLTKFSTPEEIFGPLSISELKADRFRRNTAGYLPTAQVAFLDEIFKASSSILNALLTILNERIFHNGNQPQRVPLRSLIAASNELPTGQEELGALYDRFLMRMFVGPVRDDQRHRLFDTPSEAHQATAPITERDLQAVDAAAQQVTIPQTVREAIRGIWAAHQDAFKEDRRETLSDRRLVKLLKLLRVSAATNHRTEVDLSDVMLLQHCLWNHPDNLEKVRDIVVSTLKSHSRMVPVAGEDEVYEVGADGKQLVQRPAAKQKLAVQTPAAPPRTRTKIKGFAGSGSAQDPIRIGTADDLVSMDDPDIGLAGLHFIQTADIDYSRITHWPSFEFKGHYDGQDKTIRSVKGGVVFAALQATSSVTHLRLKGCGLASTVDGSRVQHCQVSDCFMVETTSGDTELLDCQVTGGSLVGGNTLDSKIARCQVTKGRPLVEGIATNTHISDCAVVLKWAEDNSIEITGSIAASLENASVVERCFAVGTFSTIAGLTYFGGIVGDVTSSTIRQCAVGPLALSLNSARRGIFGSSSSSNRIAHKIPSFKLKKNTSIATLQNNASIDTNPGDDDANGEDGKTVAAARFNQRFFEGSLGWDFDTVWQWDSANNRPTLRLSAGAVADAAQPTSASSSLTQDLLTRQVQANIWL